MKRFLALFFIVCMLMSLLVSCDHPEEPKDNTQKDSATDINDTDPSDSDTDNNVDSENTPSVLTEPSLYAGYARVCITPDYPIKLGGYSEERVSKNVISDLYASCTAVKDKAGETVLVYSIDITSVTEQLATEIRKNIAKAVGIDYKNIILNVTHSHAAPYGTEFPDLLNAALLEAAELAVADLSPCELYGGVKEVEGLNYVRRYLCEDGSIFVSGSTSPRVARETEGDHQLSIIKFEREDKKDIVLTNWSAHVDCVKTNAPYSISSDWVGIARDWLEEENDILVSIQIGASGDMIPQSYLPQENTFTNYRNYGRDLGLVIHNMLNELQKLDSSAGIKVASEKVKVTVDKELDHLWDTVKPLLSEYSAGNKEYALSELEKLGIDYNTAYGMSAKHSNPYYHRIELTAISIGSVAITSAPYEMFSGTGINIKNASEFDITFICTLSNGSFGYIPTAFSYDNGGYGVYNSLFVRGTGEQLEKTLIDLLGEVHT